MHVLLCYDVVSLSLLIVMIWIICGAGGGLMDKKWEMMKWLHDKHDGKSISFSIKPVTIPIPLPMPIPVPMKAQKGDMKAEKPWKAESKDMFWKMMMVKMMKGDKKGDKGCSQPQCCPQMMMMMPKMKKGGQKGSMNGCNKGSNGCSGSQMNGWSMMPAMKASPMMCSQMMMPMKGCNMGMGMNGGWPPMMMMKGGWPMMKGNMMCCPSGGGGGGGGGWPGEEEEEEEEEEDWEEEDSPMMGWDTNVVPVYWHPEENFPHSRRANIFITSRKGDNSDDLFSTRRLLAYSQIFRKGINNFRNFERNF